MKYCRARVEWHWSLFQRWCYSSVGATAPIATCWPSWVGRWNKARWPQDDGFSQLISLQWKLMPINCCRSSPQDNNFDGSRYLVHAPLAILHLSNLKTHFQQLPWLEIQPTVKIGIKSWRILNIDDRNEFLLLAATVLWSFSKRFLDKISTTLTQFASLPDEQMATSTRQPILDFADSYSNFWCLCSERIFFNLLYLFEMKKFA